VEEKKDILWRVYLIYLLVFVLAAFVVVRIVRLQVVEGSYWMKVSQEFTYHYKDIEANRGSIFDINGDLLATSLPYYDVAMDVNAEPITDEIFNSKVDSLAGKLAEFFGDKKKHEYKRDLMKARNSNDRYLLLHKQVSYQQLQEIKTFPILNKGRFKGGLVTVQTNKRELPFRNLGARTIGYYMEHENIAVGIEGAFNYDLKGIGGKRLMKKIAGGVDMPVNDENEVDPQDGSDVVSTIDINLQDVVENELLKQLIKRKAKHGCVILMETSTGEVRAIANLTRKDSNTYIESYNYAIGSATEPGSTFKLASLMAAIEDGYIGLDDEVVVGDGETYFSNLPMKDSHRPKKSKMSVREVFQTSSNVGVSKIINRYYASDPQKFVDRLCKMNLDKPLGLVISGEGNPRIKKPKDKDWSGVTIPFMSIGYESLLTPMQILAFYNAVANDGKMMRPMLVKEIRKHGKTLKTYSPEQIGPPICSQNTIKLAKDLLESVVENGTGKSLKNNVYKLAGKTGTAQVAINGSYTDKYGNKTYQASFVGYFPADKPKYSIIVVVSAPSNDAYYGAEVAGPIFKHVADKIYSSSLDIHERVNDYSNPRGIVGGPFVKAGSTEDIRTIFTGLKIPHIGTLPGGEWMKTVYQDSSFVYTEHSANTMLRNGFVPNLSGMGARDALFLLENHGLIVHLTGSGKIRSQSISPGTAYSKGASITLSLGI
jgi:cell division protein FtsI (penicillin-binding protein 3)